LKEKPDTIVIKKYSNRRLYNTSTSTYINISDLIDLIKKDMHFQIIESNTNQDITRLVLTQLIFDLESKGYNLLPIEFLRYIISFYDDNLNPIFIKYLQFITQIFCDKENEWSKYLSTYNLDISNLAGFKFLEDIAQKQKDIFTQAFNFFSKNNDK
jgi:polyhydroxyalkanoate synthesis repressor PhaR